MLTDDRPIVMPFEDTEYQVLFLILDGLRGDVMSTDGCLCCRAVVNRLSHLPPNHQDNSSSYDSHELYSVHSTQCRARSARYSGYTMVTSLEAHEAQPQEGILCPVVCPLRCFH